MWSGQSAQSAQSVWQPSATLAAAYEKYCAELNAAACDAMYMEAAERSAQSAQPVQSEQSANPMQAYLDYFATRDAETAAAAMSRCPRPG